MKRFPLLALLSTLLLLLACEQSISTIGGDVIGAPGIGEYKTILLPSNSSEWGNTYDPLSGRHRYIDSLTRNGLIQKQLIIGTWHNEKSLVYMTSYDTTAVSDSLNDKSYRQMLLNAYALKDSKGNITYDTHGNIIVDTTIDVVTTTLKFSVDTTKTFSPFPTTASPNYNLQLFTGRSVKDSAGYDSSTFTLLHQAAMQKRTASFSMPIHRFNITFEAGDDLLLEENQVVTTSPRYRSIFRDSIFYNPKLEKDTLRLALRTEDTATFEPVDTLIFDTLIDWRSLINLTDYDTSWIDSTKNTTTNGSDTTIHTNHILTALKKDSTKTDTLKVHHVNRTTNSGSTTTKTIFDSTAYPLDTLHVYTKESQTINAHDSSKYDVVYVDTTVTNQAGKMNVTVQNLRAYTTKVRQATDDPLQSLLDSLGDTLNLYLSLYNPSGKEQLVHFQDPKIEIRATRVTTSTNGDIDTTIDTSTVFFNRSTMTVTSTSAHTDSTLPRMNGGREIFSRIRLRADEMWADVELSGYKFVSFAQIELPVNTTKSKLPAYAKSKITVYGIILNTDTLTPGEILRDSGDVTGDRKVLKQTLNLTDTSFTLDVSDNLHDILREYKLYLPSNHPDRPSKFPPETFLYLWIDGADMGDIYWNPSTEISLTYILQQANK